MSATDTAAPAADAPLAGTPLPPVDAPEERDEIAAAAEAIEKLEKGEAPDKAEDLEDDAEDDDAADDEDDTDEDQDDEEDDADEPEGSGKTKPNADYSKKAKEEAPAADDDAKLDLKALALKRERAERLAAKQAREKAAAGDEDDPAAPEDKDEPEAEEKDKAKGERKDQPVDPFAPALSDEDFTELAMDLPETSVKVVRKLHDQNKALTGVVKAMAQHMQESYTDRQVAAAATVRKFFAGKAKDGFADVYGNRAREVNDNQDGARAKIITRALQVREDAKRQGEIVTFEEALEAAHAAVHADRAVAHAKKQARDEIEQSVKKRHKQRDLVGGSRTARSGGDEDADAAAAVSKWERRYARR